MSKPKLFQKKPVIVAAYQWFEVSEYIEGLQRDVDYYRSPILDAKTNCAHCGRLMHDHGWMDTPEGGHIVCPGDWIIWILARHGEKYTCKPDIFAETYDPLVA